MVCRWHESLLISGMALESKVKVMDTKTLPVCMACYTKFSNMFDVTHILHTDCRRCVDNKKVFEL